MIDKKKAFEKSFKGYHKDAPAYLHAKSKALHKVKGEKEPYFRGTYGRTNNISAKQQSKSERRYSDITSGRKS